LLLEASNEQHLAEQLAQRVLGECSPFVLHLRHARQSMLRPVRLAEQWREAERTLPEGWSDARLQVTLTHPAQAGKAAALLGPLMPSRRANRLRFYAARRGAGPSPEAVERALARLDEEHVTGKLELLGSGEAAATPPATRATLAASWTAEVEALPPDWSDVYAELELTSTDHLDGAALLLAPVNPGRFGARPGFRFRVA